MSHILQVVGILHGNLILPPGYTRPGALRVSGVPSFILAVAAVVATFVLVLLSGALLGVLGSLALLAVYILCLVLVGVCVIFVLLFTHFFKNLLLVLLQFNPCHGAYSCGIIFLYF